MVDDRLMMLPVSLRLHHPQFVPHAQDHPENVGLEGGGVALRGLLSHWAGLAFGAGVVDGNVEAAEPSDGPCRPDSAPRSRGERRHG
jgi:hypothetical protein